MKETRLLTTQCRLALLSDDQQIILTASMVSHGAEKKLVKLARKAFDSLERVQRVIIDY